MHGLVNNAGVPYRARLLDMDLAGWDRVIGINLTGAMLGMRTLAPLMPADDGAAIVNIGSIAGLTAHHALAYTVSKWGLRGLSKVAALELAPRGIRVNTVHPGPIDTPISVGADPVFLHRHRGADAARPGGALGGGGRAGRLPAAARASYITGAEIPVDGGHTSHGGTKSIVDASAGAVPATRDDRRPPRRPARPASPDRSKTGCGPKRAGAGAELSALLAGADCGGDGDADQREDAEHRQRPCELSRDRRPGRRDRRRAPSSRVTPGATARIQPGSSATGTRAPPRTVVSSAKTSPAALSWAGLRARVDAPRPRNSTQAGPGQGAGRQRPPARPRVQPERGGGEPEQDRLLGGDRDQDGQGLADQDLAEAGRAGPQPVPGVPGSLVEQLRRADLEREEREHDGHPGRRPVDTALPRSHP